MFMGPESLVCSRAKGEATNLSDILHADLIFYACDVRKRVD